MKRPHMGRVGGNRWFDGIINTAQPGVCINLIGFRSEKNLPGWQQQHSASVWYVSMIRWVSHFIYGAAIVFVEIGGR